MKILVLGAGAIGGYYGARLIEGGADVTFLVRAKRAALIAERGLVVKSALGAVEAPVQTITEVSATAAYDVVLLTCKTYDLASAMDAIAPAVERGASVLPLLNGLAVYDELDARFGKSRVLGGVAYIATMLEKSGDILHMGTVDRFIVGAREPAQQDIARNVHAAIVATSGLRSLSQDIEQDLWDKWATVSPAAAVTCLMRGSVGEIMASDDGERVMRAALDECRKVAAAAGHPIGDETIKRQEALLLDRKSAWAASMRRDIAQGMPRLEVDIVGDMLRRADAAGIDAPMMRAAHAHLQVYEVQMRKQAA
jgi:2-dehydropantoate 2-reductase